MKRGPRRLLTTLDPAVLARAAALIKTLGHPLRLQIVELLERGEQTVTQLHEAVGIDQAICSQHLAKMRRQGIVQARRAGVHVRYRISDPKVYHILSCIRSCDT